MVLKFGTIKISKTTAMSVILLTAEIIIPLFIFIRALPFEESKSIEIGP